MRKGEEGEGGKGKEEEGGRGSGVVAGERGGGGGGYNVESLSGDLQDQT